MPTSTEKAAALPRLHRSSLTPRESLSVLDFAGLEMVQSCVGSWVNPGAAPTAGFAEY